MNTKIYTPAQARLIKQKAHDEAVAANERLKARRLDAAERKELEKIADDLMMGWDAA